MRDTIILDMDGTLLDTLEDLHDAVNAVLARWRCPACSLTETRAYVGNGATRLLELAAPALLSSPERETVLAEFRRDYLEHCTAKARPYPGVPELLRQLRREGFSLAVVTNKPHAAARALGEKWFPGILVMGVADGGTRKPDPRVVDAALARLGNSRARAVCVGDSEVDVKTAANAGVPCICVDWGFRSREQLRAAGASCIVSDCAALLARLRELRRT